MIPKTFEEFSELWHEYGLPYYMADGAWFYFHERIPGGSFLNAVLENDLAKATMCADGTNINLLPQYIRFLYSHAPADAWGSKENVRAHLEGK